MSDHTEPTRCDLCGQPVRVSTSPDGTSCYLPAPPDLHDLLIRLATLRDLQARAVNVYGRVLVGGMELALRDLMDETLVAIGASGREADPV